MCWYQSDPILCFLTLDDVVSGMFQDDLVNIMAADAMAPCIITASATMI